MLRHESKVFNNKVINSEWYFNIFAAFAVIGLFAFFASFGFIFAEGMYITAALCYVPWLIAGSMYGVATAHAMEHSTLDQHKAYNYYHTLSDDLRGRLGNLKADFFLNLEDHEATRLLDKMMALKAAEDNKIKATKVKDLRIVEVLSSIDDEVRILNETTKELETA